MIGELMGTSGHKLLFALDGHKLDNFGEDDNFIRIWLAFLSEKPVGVLTDGNMQERRRVTAI
jgi:hypothetical protein